MDTQQSLREVKLRLEKKLCGCCMLRDPNLMVQSTLPLVFTKMSLYHS